MDDDTLTDYLVFALLVSCVGFHSVRYVCNRKRTTQRSGHVSQLDEPLPIDKYVIDTEPELSKESEPPSYSEVAEGKC